MQTLLVTYANQATGGGIVDDFSTNGTFITTLINDTAGTHPDAPCGLAIAPANWGAYGGDLLLANNNPDSNGVTGINAYNLTTGAYEGMITLPNGQPFSETELWAIGFGTGSTAGGSAETLYFTAGLDDNANGLLGSLTAVPEPSSAFLGLIAAGLMAGGWKLKNRTRGTAA